MVLKKEHKFVLVSGNSGAGKSSIMKSLMSNEIISFTTRPQRVNEEEGKDYYFITREKFQDLLANDGLLEWSEYGGNFYGVTKSEFNKLNQAPAFCIVDFNGMNHFRELYGEDNCVSLFVYNTYTDALLQLKLRGESSDFIVKRLDGMEREIMNRAHYDYVIKNKNGYKRETMCFYNILKAELGQQWALEESRKKRISI
jgi:guanylate kinase